jgi:hypothetical protein
MLGVQQRASKRPIRRHPATQTLAHEQRHPDTQTPRHLPTKRDTQTHRHTDTQTLAHKELEGEIAAHVQGLGYRV